jgi:hypothetical protein
MLLGLQTDVQVGGHLMNRTITLLIPALIVALSANVLSQDLAEVKHSPDGKRAIAVYNLFQGSTRNCDSDLKYTGIIVQVNYDEATAAEVKGFTIETNSGAHIHFDVYLFYDDGTSILSNADKGWIPYIIAKGTKVRVDAVTCGSGGNLDANNVIVLGGTNPRRKK